jgi:hypothetical protein
MQEKIISNFEVFQKILKTKTGARAPALGKFLDQFGERIVVCPSHNLVKRSTAAPGGLVEHALNTYKIARKIVEASDTSVDAESLVIVCLLHEIGKIGDNEKDYFVSQDSSWHRERGQIYTYNPDLPKMTHAHRTLFMLQANGIMLSMDEWIAILTQAGTSSEENRFYAGCENNLAIVLQSASRLAVMKEDDN